MRSSKVAMAVGLALCAFAGAALADTINLSASLAPVVQTVKDGKGDATLVLDTTTKMVSWSVAYSGIAAPAMAAFMVPGPKPTDNPTPLMITLPSSAASPIKGSMQLTDPQIAGIQSGNWWIMLGTKDGPEIGGQVKKGQ